MSYSSEVLTDAPSVYWRLGDPSGSTIADTSGNSRSGTYNNSPTLGVAGALNGDADTAVTFNGTTQDGSIAFASWMTATSFTYEAWYRGTGTGQVIFGRASSTTIGYIGVDGTGKAFVQSKRSNATNPNATSSGSINDGNWHHIVGVGNGTTLLIYVDGALGGTNATGVAIGTDVTNAMRVASRGGSTFINGSVDECAFYPVALSAGRILAHYVAGTPHASLNATAAVVAAGTVGASASAAVSVTATIVATGQVAGSKDAALSASVAITTSGATGISGAASISATATIAADGAVVAGKSSGSDLAAVATLLADGVVGRATSAAVAVVAAIAAAGAVGLSRGASLSAAVTVTAAGTVGTAVGVTITYWDGATLQVATLSGWWDGSAIQPVTVDGWWDGSVVQALA